MKPIFLSLILLGSVSIWPSLGACQKVDTENVMLEVPQQKKVTNYEDYKSYAQYEAGEAALLKYINQNIKYPASAIDKDIQGVCLISFTVTTKGTITGVHVTKSLDPAMDEEAVRVINSLPGKWKPAVNKKGKKVPCKFTVPIRYHLSPTTKDKK